MCAVGIISPKVLKEKKTLSFIKTYKRLAYLILLAIQQGLFLTVFFFKYKYTDKTNLQSRSEKQISKVNVFKKYLTIHNNNKHFLKKLSVVPNVVYTSSYFTLACSVNESLPGDNKACTETKSKVHQY